MCGICGCGEGHLHLKEHDHEHNHQHTHSHAAAHSHAPGLSPSRMVQIEQNILAKNNQYAHENRRYFSEHGLLALNLVSSPGSGKTTLLTETSKPLVMQNVFKRPVYKPYKSIPAKAVILMRIESVMP